MRGHVVDFWVFRSVCLSGFCDFLSVSGFQHRRSLLFNGTAVFSFIRSSFSLFCALLCCALLCCALPCCALLLCPSLLRPSLLRSSLLCPSLLRPPLPAPFSCALLLCPSLPPRFLGRPALSVRYFSVAETRRVRLFLASLCCCVRMNSSLRASATNSTG